MPFASNDELPEGVKNLPPDQQTKWRKIFNAAYDGTCKDEGDRRDECAARVAWSQIDEKYKGKSSPVARFSMAITKASLDEATGEMRWVASASDTDEDSYGDNMSLELFQDFIRRIEENEPAPEEFRSEFWQGGKPYLSISHYPDLNGKAVPGVIDTVYVDGKFFKSKGRFFDTPLGRACFNAIREDKGKAPDEKVRISIAFLDWKHQHKSPGNFTFTRKSTTDICPECLRELIAGKSDGKIFLSGQLIHEAMTRVPVNTRTSMEVDLSMAKTRKEDAESIIGEELAEELEKEAAMVGKSEALVIKSDEEYPEDIFSQVDDGEYGEDEWLDELEDIDIEIEEKADLVSKAVTKREGGCEHPMSHYLIHEDPEKVTTWHLRYKDCSGKIDRRLLGAAWAALTAPGGHRGNKYEGPGKQEAIAKLKKLRKAQGMEEPKAMIAELLKSMQEIKAMLQPKQLASPQASHPLDEAIAKLKADFDEAMVVEGLSADERMRLLQDPFNALAETIKAKIVEKSAKPPVAVQADETVKAFSEALKPLVEQMSLLATQVASIEQRIKPATPQTVVIPERRSLSPAIVQQAQIRAASTTPKLRALIERTT